MPLDIPPLPQLDNDEEMKELFISPSANWVIPGVLIAGASPARSASVPDTMKDLRVGAGVTTFVCLQSEVPPQTEDGTDFGGTKDGNEADKLPSYAAAAREVDGVPEPKFVYYGIRDEEEAESVEVLHTLIDDLLKRIKDEEVLYVHCKGGTGRTGLVVASILGRVYPSISADEVLQRTHEYCIMRWKAEGKWVNPKVKSPATEGQVEQVKEYLEFVKKTPQNEDGGQGCVIH